jgi:hypothetical protein
MQIAGNSVHHVAGDSGGVYLCEHYNYLLAPQKKGDAEEV